MNSLGWRWFSWLSLSMVLGMWCYPSWAQGHPLVDQVWYLVQQEYFDPGFSPRQWENLRHQILAEGLGNDHQIYGAIQEALESLGDPYTRLIDPRLAQEQDSFVGVGLHLGVDPDTGYLVTIAPVDHSSAFYAGIWPGDLITAIEGVSTQGMELDEAIARICGQKGTSVTLSLRRQHQDVILKVPRQTVTLDPVRQQLIRFGEQRWGYIRLAHFTEGVPQQMQAAIQELESQEVKGYILDLRGNPGGLVSASTQVAQMWLQQGTIVTLKDRDGQGERIMASDSALTDKPLAVLVDQGTASASEILSAALQDHRRGILVGTSSFGKGSVQSLHTLAGGAGLAVTTAQYLTPQGFAIDQRGIEPDVRVELSLGQRQRLAQDRDLVATAADPQFMAALRALGSTQISQHP